MKMGPRFIWTIVTAICVASYAKGEKESKIVGRVGSHADLICDVDVSICGRVYFITWTKNVSNEWKRLYLYSDAVEKPLQELANPDRADFYLKESTGFLRISPLKLEDDGVYKCDVTYVQGKCPSLSFATLTIHAEPSSPVIEKDGKVSSNGSVVGPFYEGVALQLDCETAGGKPTPEVTWFKGQEELDSESRVTIEKNGASSVTSSVKVTLGRADLGTRIECRVDNEAVDDPLVSWVEVDLHVGPSSLEVSGPTEPITSGNFVTFTCIIEGAKPAAQAIWYNRSEILQGSPEVKTEASPDGTYKTTSIVQIPVTRHDHFGTYYCKGTNSVLQSKGEAALLKSLDLQVLYPPAIVVQPAQGVLVNESVNVDIYCTYEANPFNITQMRWYHGGKLIALPSDGKYKLTMQGYPTLTVRDVQKEDKGLYTCSLENEIGRGNATNSVEVNVLYPPIVGAMISPEDLKEGDSISLFCDILEGNPQNLLGVRWYKDGNFHHETSARETVWTGATRNNSGNYSCEGQNSAGWGQRSEVSELLVRFLPGPAVLLELDPPSIKGKTTSLQCVVEDSGLPRASIFRWELDGDLLATTTSENFTTEHHKLLSRGNYSCAAVNEVGVGGRGYAYLAVKAPPRFIDDLPDIHGTARDAPFIEFLCRVECDPLCEIHWKRDDRVIDEDDQLFIIKNRINSEDRLNNAFLSMSSTLQFNMTAWPGRRLLRERDRSNYTCYSTANSVGDGVSSTLLFQVEYPPEQMSLSDSQVDVVEGRVPDSVECTASSWPPSTYFWKKADMVIAKDDYLRFNDTVVRENSGTYVCVAENAHGRAQIEMLLNVLYKPECKITEDEDDDAGDMVLVCTANGNPSFINFTWIKDNETLEDDYEMSQDGTRSKYYLPEEASQRFGLYVCIVVNDVGESECEMPVDRMGFARGYRELGDKSVLIIAAVIGGIAILFVLVIIAIIIIMKKRRLQGGPTPGKPMLGLASDNLYQNVAGHPQDSKQNGPPSDSEGNAMYENMPFHRQGQNHNYPSNRMKQTDFSSHAYQNVPYGRTEWGSPPKGNGHCGAPLVQMGGQNLVQRSTAPPFQRKEHFRFEDPLHSPQLTTSLKMEPCPQHGHHQNADLQRSWGRSHSRENGGTTQNCAAGVIYADLALPSQNSQKAPSKRLSGTQYATLKFNQEHALQTGQQ